MPSKLSAEEVAGRIAAEQPNNTGLRALAAAAGKDQGQAVLLWRMGSRKNRMAAVLMLDPRQTAPALIEDWLDQVEAGPAEDAEVLGDWLLTNLIIKRPPLVAYAKGWEGSPSILRQRLFWYTQMRVAKELPADEQDRLVAILERELGSAPPSVQWTMNLAAGQIGILNPDVRQRCISLGERLGLYKDYPTPKGCTSPYLPLWINAIVARDEKA